MVIAGPRGDAVTEALIQAAHSVFAPDKVPTLGNRSLLLGCGRLLVLMCHLSSGRFQHRVVDAVMCWPLLQVVISINPMNEKEMDYWKQHNQEAYSMVEGAAEKLKDRCAVAAGPWTAMAYTFL